MKQILWPMHILHSMDFEIMKQKGGNEAELLRYTYISKLVFFKVETSFRVLQQLVFHQLRTVVELSFV
jgi:hypothetical protein